MNRDLGCIHVVWIAESVSIIKIVHLVLAHFRGVLNAFLLMLFWSWFLIYKKNHCDFYTFSVSKNFKQILAIQLIISPTSTHIKLIYYFTYLYEFQNINLDIEMPYSLILSAFQACNYKIPKKWSRGTCVESGRIISTCVRCVRC